MKKTCLLLITYLCSCTSIADTYGTYINAEIIETIDPVTFVVNITQKGWPKLIRENILVRVLGFRHIQNHTVEPEQRWQPNYKQHIQLENFEFTDSLDIVADLYINNFDWGEQIIRWGIAERTNEVFPIPRPHLKSKNKSQYHDTKIRKIIGFKGNRLLIQPLNWPAFIVSELSIIMKNFKGNIDTQDKESIISSELHNFIQSLENPVWLKEIEKNEQLEIMAKLMHEEYDISQHLNQFCKDKGWKTAQEAKKSTESPPINSVQQQITPDEYQTIHTFPVQQREPDLKLVKRKWTEIADRWLQKKIKIYTRLKIVVAHWRFYFSKPSIQEIAKCLGSFGALGIKIGQIIATMEDLPSEHRKHFLPLCDTAQPVGFPMIKRAIDQAELAIAELKTKGDISVDLIQVVDIEQQHLGTGSIAQVHKGKIIYKGEPVECVFKVVKEGVQRELQDAFDNLQPILDFINSHMSKEFSDKIFYNLTGISSTKSNLEKKALNNHLNKMQDECDMKMEKTNLELYKKAIDELELNFVSVPTVYFATRHVLIMEYIPGKTLSSLYLENKAKADALYLQGWDQWEEIAKRKNLIHGDFHPGNVILKESKKNDSPDELVLIDGAAIMNNCLSVKLLNNFKKYIRYIYKRNIITEKCTAPALINRTNQERVEYMKRLLTVENGTTRFKTKAELLATPSKEAEFMKSCKEAAIFLLEHFEPPFFCFDLSPQTQFNIALHQTKSAFLSLPDFNNEEERKKHLPKIASIFLDHLAQAGFSLPEAFSYRHQSYVRMKRFKGDRDILLQKDEKYRIAAANYERESKAKKEAEKKVQDRKTNPAEEIASLKQELMKKPDHFKRAALNWHRKNLAALKNRVHNHSLFQDWFIYYSYSESLKNSQ